MSLIEQFKNNVINKFESKRVPGTNKKALREGYYLIKSISYKEVGLNSRVALAQVNWTFDNSQPFLDSLEFTVAISSFLQDKTLREDDIFNLVGMEIFVFESRLIEDKVYGISSMSIKWTYSQSKITTINESNIAAHLFFSSASTFNEAWNNFAKTVDYDIYEAIEYEATKPSNEELEMYELEALGDVFIEDLDFEDCDIVDGAIKEDL